MEKPPSAKAELPSRPSAPNGWESSFAEEETADIELPPAIARALREAGEAGHGEESLQDLLPLQLGEYALIEFAGSGSLGQVYQAQDAQGRVFALKLLRRQLQQDERIKKDFIELGKRLRRISHPALLKIKEIGEGPWGPWWAMEWLRGRPLSVHLAQGIHWSGRQLAQAIRPVCEALELAHRAGLVHGDLKPEHLFLREQRGGERLGKRLRPQLLLFDFGLAIDDRHQGSLGYMSPEQISGAEVSTASDLYSLGVLLYQLTTHELPHPTNGDLNLWIHHVLSKPADPPSSRLRPWPYGAALDSIILNLLSRNPKERCTLPDLIRFLSRLEGSADGIQTPFRGRRDGRRPDSREHQTLDEFETTEETLVGDELGPITVKPSPPPSVRPLQTARLTPSTERSGRRSIERILYSAPQLPKSRVRAIIALSLFGLGGLLLWFSFSL